MSTLLVIGLTNALIATVLAMIVWGVTRVWRQPTVAQLLWVLVLIKLVTPPIVSIPWRFVQEHQNDLVPLEITTPLQHHAANGTNDTSMPTLKPKWARTDNAQIGVPVVRQIDATTRRPLPWTTIAIAVWLAGSGVWILTAAVRLSRFHRALRNTVDCSADLQHMADEIARKLGITSRFRLRMTEARLSPLVWPIGRPTIVLSRPLLTELSHEETQTLLTHELSHLRRKDHWLRWLELFVTAIYWWHPVVWWARHMIQKAEEQACDAWVVWAFPNAATCYASALFKAAQMVSDHRFGAPSIASRLGSSGNLKERIEDIMNATWKCRLSLPAQVAVVLTAVLILPLSWHAVYAGAETKPPTKSDKAAGQGDSPQQPTTTEMSEPQTIGDRRDKAKQVHAQRNSSSKKGVLSVDHADYSELDAIREHVDFLENQFTKIDALYRTGSSGGRVEVRAMAGYELVTARSELAQAEGHYDQAIANSEQAVKFADEAVKAVSASYDAGRVPHDLVLQASRNITDSRLRLSRVRQSANAKPTSSPSASSIRSSASQELANMESPTRTQSLGMLQKMLERRKSEYERSAKLADQGTISASELSKVKEEYELSADHVRQAQRELQYRKVVLEVAQAEYQQALEANKRAAGAVSSSELRRLEALVKLAQVKLNQIGD